MALPNKEDIQPFISQIRTWYKNDDTGFRTFFDAAVENVKPIPEGTDESVHKDWKRATIDTLCAFFEEWYEWLPEVPEGLDYIQKFSWLYYQNKYGLTFVTKGKGYEMTKEFVTLRGAYLDSADSTDLVDQWIEELGGADAVCSEFVCPTPGAAYQGFSNFNEFFARELNTETKSRPITAPDDDSVVVAPADSVINMIVDDLTLETKIPVKTVFLNVKELLNNSSYAERFDGGL